MSPVAPRLSERRSTSRIALIASPIAVFLLAAGCGRPSAELSSPTAKKMQCLAAVYMDYAGARGIGPASDQQLLEHIENVPAFMLPAAEFSAATAEQLFCSDRDGLPLVIRHRVAFEGAENIAASPIVHERQGKDGKVLVVYADSRMQLVESSVLGLEPQQQRAHIAAEETSKPDSTSPAKGF